MVTSFRYLGRVILAADHNWSAVLQNLVKGVVVWRSMTSILRWEGVEPQVSGFFFKYVIQSVLLFGTETWVVTPRMGQFLGGFQDQVARRFTGWIPWRRADGRWKYTSAEAERVEVGFETIEAYICKS